MGVVAINLLIKPVGRNFVGLVACLGAKITSNAADEKLINLYGDVKCCDISKL